MEKSELRLLRLPDVIHKTGLSRASIYRRISRNEFPAPRKLGAASFWPQGKVDEWINCVANGQVWVADAA